MKIEYPYTMPHEEAKQRLEALGDYLKNRHNINVTWNGDKASFKGKYLVVSIEGSLTLDGKKVLFDGKDPGFLWRGKAADYIKKKLTQYLDPAKAIEELPRR
jgi:hypothetical protein